MWWREFIDNNTYEWYKLYVHVCFTLVRNCVRDHNNNCDVLIIIALHMASRFCLFFSSAFSPHEMHIKVINYASYKCRRNWNRENDERKTRTVSNLFFYIIFLFLDRPPIPIVPSISIRAVVWPCVFHHNFQIKGSLIKLPHRYLINISTAIAQHNWIN